MGKLYLFTFLYLCHASSRFMINFIVDLIIPFLFFDFRLTIHPPGMWVEHIASSLSLKLDHICSTFFPENRLSQSTDVWSWFMLRVSLATVDFKYVVYTQLIVNRKIVLHGGRPWKQLCSHSGRATK